jgi:sulfite exporter TauE/SafE
MGANVGGIDRTLRIVVGLAILALGLIVEGPARWWTLLGVIPLVTGLAGWCPAYKVFGIRTCATR